MQQQEISILAGIAVSFISFFLSLGLIFFLFYKVLDRRDREQLMKLKRRLL